MKYEHDGITIWSGTADAPAPGDAVSAGKPTSVTIGVRPQNASHEVKVLYRVNNSADKLKELEAKWIRSDASGRGQYYRAEFPSFQTGDRVEYTPVCRCVDKQVPHPAEWPNESGGFVASFEVTDELLDAGIEGKHAASPNLAPVVPPGHRDADRVSRVRKDYSSPSSSAASPIGDAPQSSNGDEKYYVNGKVESPSRAGVGELRVEILDKNVYEDVCLAEAVTDEGGSYGATFTMADLCKRGKQRPDLQVRAFAGPTFLGASEVRYNASDHETLNVLLTEETSSALPSEYETLFGALARHYGGRLGDLKESDDRQDITYLANKSGWDARAVAMAALSDQFNAGTITAGGAGIHPAFYYALFRAGLPSNPDTLHQADPHTVEQVWKEAIDQGVIPHALQNEISTALQAFQSLSAQKLLTSPALVGASSMTEMLTSSGLKNDQQRQFAALYTQHRADLPTFWQAIGDAFGKDAANRLQLDGKLSFLTINNASLMQQIHNAVGKSNLADPLQLAQLGYHRAEPWRQLLTGDVPIPKEIPGETQEVKQSNYADYLAAQVRLSYPTAAIAHMVKSGDLPLPGAAPRASNQVHDFLTQHQGKFEIGVQPVQQYVVRKNLQVADETITQVKRLQRVYQITPSDQAMAGLMKRGLDAAFHVVRHDRDTFVQTFQQDLGGAESAAQTYDRSVQVHNAVLNIAVSYITARNGIGLGAERLEAAGSGPDGTGQILRPAPRGPSARDGADVIAYPTLEGLFGEMDFCACDHCRSVLSPAAYLVDLLNLIGPDPDPWTAFIDKWKKEHRAPYPYSDATAWENAGKPPNTEISPLEVLLSRRPDIQHLPLTCENTNTVLPYLDVVNETLEYFIANTVQKLSLNDYVGHDTDGATTEDLMASPQFVMDAAYSTLRGERFPAPLPFHQPLENLRRYFDKFEVPLPIAMERLRTTDDLERGGNSYGWRDILMEDVRLSREDYEILTDSVAVPLWRMYGFPNQLSTPDGSLRDTTDADVIGTPLFLIGTKALPLSNAKLFCRHVGISYEDLIAILKTRFVNPNSDLIPKLERLGVALSTLKALKEGTITDDAFDALLPQGPAAIDPAEYGGDVKAWVKNDANFARIMALITLTSGLGDPDPCYFDSMELRFAKPMDDAVDTATRLGVAEFIRLLRFIRLWKKMNWTVEQTDAAICALYRTDLAPLIAENVDTATELDAGFLTLLPRLGIIVRIMKVLNLSANVDLLPLLACWSEIGTHGSSALYREMFLNLAMLKQDAVFADNAFGNYLQRAQVAYIHSQATLDQSIMDAAQGKIGYNDSIKLLSYAGILNSATRDALKTVPGVSQDFQDAVDGLFRAQRLAIHTEALRSAFNLTGNEYEQIVSGPADKGGLYGLGYGTETPLTLPNISAIYRRGWLARKLSLSVRELLLLTHLTGLNPFAALDPMNPTILRLITLVQGLKERSLKTSAVLYLIWNKDLSGKSAPDPLQSTEFARTLRGDFAAIDEQLAAIEDPGGDVARARIALVYGPETADTFFALLEDTVVLDVAYAHPQSSLEAAITAADPWIAYDAFRRRLSRTGLLNVTTRDTLKSIAGVRKEFQGAVEALFARSEDIKGSFFARHPELRSVYDETLALDGTLVLAMDYTHSATTLEASITAVDPRVAYDNTSHRLTYSGLLTAKRASKLRSVPGVNAEFQAAVDALFALGHEAKSKILAQLQPELGRGRKRQQALQRLSAMAGTDLAFAQALLDTPTAPHPLHAASHVAQPALDDVVALETQGLAVQFFFRETATKPIDREIPAASNLDYAPGGDNPLPTPSTAGATISGIWRGKVEAPEAGFYNFIVVTDSEATVKLQLGGLGNRELTQNGTVWRNIEPLELKGGTLYDIVLTIEKVKETVQVKWETPKRTRQVIPARYLYPPTILAPFSETYLRFLKAAALAEGLHLTPSELAHFATDLDYLIDKDGWLNALPVNGDPSDAAALALLQPLQALLHYTRIKAALSPGDELLLRVLQDPAEADGTAKSSLFALTRWDPVSLKIIFAHFDTKPTDLAHFEQFRRVHDALALIQTMGLPASALIEATTNAPDGNVVRDLQAALHARYDNADWRGVLQPINDELRGLQRDSLVAYILHHMRSNSDTAHIDTPDKLFEYFLMDVQMEPCMQTSRIRHALSSVQLFIERCLMNLEARVSPAALNAKHWEWMKRYRLWEANRKVFLWPENWLEPGLRDDKSPFFKEIESQLLQSDITEDAATTALLNYLSKLAEVATLEPCGIYHLEADPIRSTGRIDHIIARTSGANRNYYYRRREGGSWTPWEHVKLAIEDNPISPVVWKDRLLLFWLRVLKQPDTEQPVLPPNKNLTQLTTTDVNTAPAKMTTGAVLCWSEYYNGKWQPIKTSDVTRPTFFPKDLSGLDRSSFYLEFLDGNLFSDQDFLRVQYIGRFGSMIGGSWFDFYNTHGLPIRMEDDPSSLPAPRLIGRIIWDFLGILGFNYFPPSMATRVILKGSSASWRATAPQQELQNPFIAPFFFADSRHVFFVTTTELPVRISDYSHYGISIDPKSTQTAIRVALKRFVTEDVRIRQGIGTTGTVMYGNKQIWPPSAVSNERAENLRRQ